MKKTNAFGRKLKLDRVTVRRLESGELDAARGGARDSAVYTAPSGSPETCITPGCTAFKAD